MLTELGNRYQPTKRYHNSLPVYDFYFAPTRTQIKTFIEIGVQTNRSVRMWKDYFPNAIITGIDIDPVCKDFEEERIQIHIGSQDNIGFLSEVLHQIPAPEIIIDDGSHKPIHQIGTFRYLFPLMAEYGYYCIEDLGGEVGDTRLNTPRFFADLAVNALHYWPKGLKPGEWINLSSFPDADIFTQTITGIFFYRSLIIIRKGHNPGDNPFLGNLDRDVHNLVKLRSSSAS